MAVIKNYPQNRQAAEALQFREVRGEPGWAFDGQVSEPLKKSKC
jgi:hypothetical protein